MRWRWPYRFVRRFRKTPKVICLSQAAMSNWEGSWAVLAGVRPSQRMFGLALDEDQIQDSERWQHMLEPIDYFALDGTGVIELMK